MPYAFPGTSPKPTLAVVTYATLALQAGYQKEGIGKKLIGLTKEKAGEQTMILLLSVPTAMTYYPKVGFTKEDRSFAIYRTK